MIRTAFILIHTVSLFEHKSAYLTGKGNFVLDTIKLSYVNDYAFKCQGCWASGMISIPNWNWKIQCLQSINRLEKTQTRWLFPQTSLVSLHIRSMWETTVMHKQVSGCTVNFGPNFPESPFLEVKTRKPPPPISENFRFGMTKVYSGIPPHFGKLQIWDDQS